MKSRVKIFAATVVTLAIGWSAAFLITHGAGEAAKLAARFYSSKENLAQVVETILPTKEKTYSETIAVDSKAVNDTNESTADVLEPTVNLSGSTEKQSGDSLTVLIGGDVMFDRGIRLIGERYGYDSLLKGVAPTFKAADIVVANLEGPITDEPSKTLFADGTTGDSFIFTFAPETAAALARAGITAVSLANNHSDNFGIKGIEETRKYLDEAGVKWFGTPWNAASNETTVCKKGTCVALVGYHAFQGGFDRIVAEVKELAGKDYFIVVMPHWGEEYSAKPTERMREQARELVTAGADAVIGSHSHVVGENEWLGNIPVYYSLGNLLFDQYFSPETMNGMLVELTISRNEGKSTLDHVRTINVSNASKRGIDVVDKL